ncbi:hybrid sensor histidine kinase/response regulator [Schlegelella sp. S2-27]|uniref:histidine kinase n=2 Tax=Caldimonas mangrovi TaxID=2944811 RepID=A0ABT0YSR5_9BURK|nr:hybrid sensor histidine kinase/response regulator [Caldimonas mangrovi]
MPPALLRATRLLAGLLAAWLLAAAWPAGAADALPGVQTVDAAVFDAPGRAPERVALPDTWAHRSVDRGTPGRYRFGFELAKVPQESLALTFTRLSSHHQVYVNDALVAGHAQGPRESNPGVPVPTLISVPPSFLRAGHNTVVVEVRYVMRAGLSQVNVGPMSALRQDHQRYLLSRVALPQALNLGAAALALFMMLIWWLRRSEVALGSFGALVLLGSVRNYSYFLDTAVTSARASDWIFYTANVASAVLLGVFAQAFAGVRWPRYTRALLAALVVLPALGAWAAWHGELQVVRGYTYPLMLAACMPVLWLCGRRAWSHGGWSAAGQALGIGAMLAAVGHDYAMQTANWLPITHGFWIPYVMPLTLGLFSLALLHRMVKAMGEVEALNTELEARVATRTRQLEQANAAKTRFLASASHDLRQPLVTIGLLVGLVKDSSESARMRQMMDRVDEAVGAMEGLLTGLLDLSQLDSGTVQAHRAAVRVADLFDAIELHEQPAAALKGLRLRLRPTPAVIESDPVMLDRIVRNLVSNAVKYTERGGVLVAARRRGDKVRIEIHDTGIGISEEHRQAVFQEFVQLDNPQRERSRGMGLGLAIVQRTAAMLGHEIGLRSQPGRGSCFWVEVPAAQRAPSAAPAQQPVPRLQGRRVLLVEDDPTVREAMVARLQSWGAQVYPCTSLADLRRWLAQAGDLRLDLLLSDYRLPDGDGLQVLAEVRARFGAVRALVVTGDTGPEELGRLHEAGVQVLHKPFRGDALLQALQA